MVKRAVSSLLWFYVILCAWSYVSVFTGVSQLAGPLLGAAVGMFVAADPWGWIWETRPAQDKSPRAGSTPAPTPADPA